MKSKLPSSIFIVLAIVGLFLFGLSAYSFIESKNLEEGGEVINGQIVEIKDYGYSHYTDYHYSPLIEFSTKQGTKFKFYSDRIKYKDSYSVGQEVPVVYIPSDPSKAKIYSFSSIWMKPIVSFLIAFIFTSLGIGGFYSLRKRAKLELMLNTSGRKVIAKVISIDEIASSKRTKCVINAQYLEGNKSYLFTSDILDLAPSELQGLEEVEITVDPTNYGKYIVNTEELSRLSK